MKIEKIIVIGTGYVGLPAALMWAKSGIKVVGVDINENLVKAINDRTLLLNELELNILLESEEVKSNLIAQTTPCEGDVFVIAVPTPIHPLKKVADLSYVKSALLAICPFLRKGNLIIIESTIPPLTTRDFVKSLIEENSNFKVPKDILLAHCPERILPGDIFREIVENDRLIGGLDQASSDASAKVYSVFVKGQLHLTSDLIAELSKLMENTYRDVNIALANEFSLICEDIDADTNEVISYANKHPRVNILSPGIGVGGHCIPIDPWFLKEIAPNNSRLISTARYINDEMPLKMAAKVRSFISGIENPKIIALGLTYKRNCEDERESPAKKIGELLVNDGYDITMYDPLVPNFQYENIVSIADNADLLLVLVAHDLIKKSLIEEKDLLKEVMRNNKILILDK